MIFFRQKISLIKQTLFLATLPLLSLFGTQLLSPYYMNILISFMVILLSLLPVLIAFDKISEQLYPFAIMSMAIALLYSTSLNSPYLRGTDIHQEYYFANLVLTNSNWNSTVPHTYNSMLSVVMVAPILTIVTGMPLIWVFKIFYPLLFSLVPVILFQIFKRQTAARSAFFAVFFLVSVFSFYTEMVGLARQQIGEIFLVIIVLLMILKPVICGLKKSLLLMIFGTLLVMSHYALACIFIGLAIFVLFYQHFQNLLSSLKSNLLKRLHVT
ncbi:MAG: hypothetical protein QW279_04635, partial [Candidatus Jordarchaeaceae archaeon]